MTRILLLILASQALHAAEQVIVYRSKAEQSLDAFIWENSEYALIFIGILLAVPVAMTARRWFRGLRRR